MNAFLQTSFGPRLAAPPRPLVIPAEPGAALRFAERVDREADQHLAAGGRA